MFHRASKFTIQSNGTPHLVCTIIPNQRSRDSLFIYCSFNCVRKRKLLSKRCEWKNTRVHFDTQSRWGGHNSFRGRCWWSNIGSVLTFNKIYVMWFNACVNKFDQVSTVWFTNLFENFVCTWMWPLTICFFACGGSGQAIIKVLSCSVFTRLFNEFLWLLIYYLYYVSHVHVLTYVCY